MLLSAPLRQTTITELSTLAPTWIRQARYPAPKLQDVLVKLNGTVIFAPHPPRLSVSLSIHRVRRQIARVAVPTFFNENRPACTAS